MTNAVPIQPMPGQVWSKGRMARQVIDASETHVSYKRLRMQQTDVFIASIEAWHTWARTACVTGSNEINLP